MENTNSKEALRKLQVGLATGITGDKLNLLRVMVAKEMDNEGSTVGFAEYLTGSKKETTKIDPLPMTDEDWAMISMGGQPF